MKLFQTSLIAALGVSSTIHPPAPTGSHYPSGFDITQSWANLSPYQDAASFGLPKGVPQGCQLSQVHVLHRHAQRYPIGYFFEAGTTVHFNQKVANYSKTHPGKKLGDGPLGFLDHWTYMLGEELLLTTGAATEAASGAEFWNKYGRLLYRAGPNVAGWDESLNTFPNGTARPKPVFRTASQARIVESARWWLSGFFGNTGANSSYSQYDLVEIPEVENFNITLAAYKSCPGDKTEGDNEVEVFINKYTKNAIARLSQYLPSDFNLTPHDILAMQNLCVHEYTGFAGSFFCSLFTEQEWKDYAYSIEIEYYGDHGYGSPTGRAQGIGWVLELAARLQHKLITSSDTSINTTFTDNEAQFPFHQPFYMDMSHDSTMISVITALGFEYFKFGPNGLPGDLDHAPNRTFQMSQITPFGARLIAEIWTCPSNTSFSKLDPVLYQNPKDLKSENANKNTTDYIRFVLNGSPLPTKGLVGCENARNGFCPVKDFLEGVPALKEHARYQYVCFGKYPRGGQVGDGVPA